MTAARTPAAMLHAIAGSPTQDGCESHDARCVVCAQLSARTARYDDWQGATVMRERVETMLEEVGT